MRSKKSIRDIPRMSISEFSTSSDSRLTYRPSSSNAIISETGEEKTFGKPTENRVITGHYPIVPVRRLQRRSGKQRTREKLNAYRSKLPVLRRERRTQKEDEQDKQETLSLMRKVGISAVVCLAVIAFKSIDTPITRDITEGVRIAITGQFDMDKTLGRLKFVKEYFPNVASVFSEEEKKPGNLIEDQTRLSPPAEGKVIVKFGQILETKKRSEGIMIQGEKGAPIYAAADGEVIAIQEDKTLGTYIDIRHEDEMISRYGNCTQTLVKKGDKVLQKDVIGKLGKGDKEGDTVLYFEVKVQGKAIDPLDVIRENNKLPR
jgi:murein DD-endopeptidase MepM/ murein hydrolase activator NlpD